MKKSCSYIDISRPASGRETLRRTPDGRRRHAGYTKQTDQYRQGIIRYGKDELYSKLEEQGTFLFPETNKGHDSYVQGRIKALALNDAYKNDFDILAYADMLFWIEQYNISRL